MEIYVDIIFLENVVLNYFILYITKMICKLSVSTLRMFLGSVAGAIYVVILIMYPEIGIYYSSAGKFILSVVIVCITFRINKIRDLVKYLVAFYLSTFVLAGAAFALMYLSNNEGFVQNGIVYIFWQSKWISLLLAVIVVCIIGRIFFEIIYQRNLKDKFVVPLTLVFDNRETNINALIDTGNSLHDPITMLPVVIVEYAAVKENLPDDIQSIFEKDKDLDKITEIVSNSEWTSRFRLIPFTSIGNAKGIIIGFKPDYIEIERQGVKCSIKDVIVGIHNEKMSSENSYSALIGPELI